MLSRNSITHREIPKREKESRVELPQLCFRHPRWQCFAKSGRRWSAVSALARQVYIRVDGARRSTLNILEENYGHKIITVEKKKKKQTKGRVKMNMRIESR